MADIPGEGHEKENGIEGRSVRNHLPDKEIREKYRQGREDDQVEMPGIVFRKQAEGERQYPMIDRAADIKNRPIILHRALKIIIGERERVVPADEPVQIKIPSLKMQRFIPGDAKIVECDNGVQKKDTRDRRRRGHGRNFPPVDYSSGVHGYTRKVKKNRARQDPERLCSP
ncbi:MAG: hypothetical protein V1789_07800 [PVC group bacterium]